MMQTFLRRVLCVACVAFIACTGGDAVSSDVAALHQGGGDGPPVWANDPCNDPSVKAKANIHDSNGDHIFVGTEGDDIIFGTDQRDVIYGKGGNDIICALGGDDEIHGGDGADYIDGGAGDDLIYGDDGADLVHGRAGSDEIHGGDGDDLLFGDLLDDKLFGDDGSDLLVGGHGTDEMHGGKGNDWLRGDTGNDSFFGDEGDEDVISFMTAMPPTEAEPDHEHADDGIDGVIVNFNDACMDPNDPAATPHDGCAFGDGKYEPIDGVEVVVGSAFNDHFIGKAAGGIKFVGGFGDDKFDVPHSADIVDGEGNDMCNGKSCGKPGTAPAAGKVFVFVDADHERDVGVIILGTPGDDTLSIHPDSKHLDVTSSAGTTLDAGPGCHQQGATQVQCDIDHTLRYVSAYGNDGNDKITLTGDFPRDFTAHVNGGKDNDILTGGDEQDVLFSGITGNDWLYGNGGDDALLSESEESVNHLKLSKQIAYADGADHLFGGDGNDQLVSDFPCGGHEYSGGNGVDIAGFARSGKLPLYAQLAQWDDNPSVKMGFYARAYNPHLVSSPGAWCPLASATTLHPDLEILEGSSADDLLYGNDNDNIIWGRDGDDEIHGLGGNDIINGLQGNDHIYGEGGSDTLIGGAGFDFFYAADGEHDTITCGPNGGRVMAFDQHDQITGCKYK